MGHDSSKQLQRGDTKLQHTGVDDLHGARCHLVEVGDDGGSGSKVSVQGLHLGQGHVLTVAGVLRVGDLGQVLRQLLQVTLW